MMKFCLIIIMTIACTTSAALAQDDSAGNIERPEILKRQQKLAEQYELLEQKLFTLYGYEKDKNPTRAKLLDTAYQRSQSSATTAQLKDVVGLIENAKLRQAEGEQAAVLEKLNEMLALLQSEDRSARLKDEIERYQEYLKEVEKLLRLQKSLRGQTEGGVDQQRIAKSESQAADRANKLSENIKTNEETPEEEELETEPPTAQDGDEETESADEGSSKEDGSKGGESEKSDPNGSSPKEGEQTAGESGTGKPSDAEQPDNANPVRKQIDAAEKRMRSAQKKLQEAQPDDAIEEMKEAEKEIALAKKQLEEILRQKREEEVERTLAKLEERFRKMLEREIRMKQSTEKLAAIDESARGTDFDVQTGKLSTEQNAIAADAGRALLLLAEDGSSVAFIETVDEMNEDMLQIAARLSAAKVGDFTIDLETEVIDTLNYLVAALEQTQRENEEKKESSPKGGGKPQPAGEEPLVGNIAELKMLRSLQDRIYRRHQRYSQQLESPDDIVGVASDPELVAALKRLTEKQKKLAQITQDIVTGEDQ